MEYLDLVNQERRLQNNHMAMMGGLHGKRMKNRGFYMDFA